MKRINRIKIKQAIKMEIKSKIAILNDIINQMKSEIKF